MAKSGYHGYTAQIQEYKGEQVIFCWSLRPIFLPMEGLPNLIAEIMDTVTEDREAWIYWHDKPLTEVNG